MDMIWVLVRFLILLVVMIAALKTSMFLANVRVRSTLSVSIAVGLFCTLLLMIPWIGWLIAGFFAFRCLAKLTNSPLLPDSLVMAAGTILVAQLCKFLLF